MLPVHQVSISNVAMTSDAPKWDCLVVGEAQSKPFGFVKDGKVSAGNFQRILNKLIIRAFGGMEFWENSEEMHRTPKMIASISVDLQLLSATTTTMRE